MDKKLRVFSNFLGLDLPYFIGGGFWIALALVVTTISGIFLSSIFARVWPADVYGQYTFLLSAIGFLSLTALPGIGVAITQAVAEGKEGVYRQGLYVVAKWSLIGSILLLFGALYFYLRQNSNLALASTVAAVAFPITSTAALYSYFLNGKKQFKKVSLLTSLVQLVSIGVTALALWKFPSIVIVTLAATWSVAAVNLILTFNILSKVKNDITDKSAIKLGFHLSFSQGFTMAADYLDRFLIPLLLGFATNATYAFAILIPMQLHGVFKIFGTLGQPKIAEKTDHHLKKDLPLKSLQLEILIILIVLIYIILAPTIFQLLFPNYKDSAVFLSQLFSLSLLYFPVNLLALSFVKQRASRKLVTTNVVYLVSSLIGLIILIPVLGILGAVIAKIISRVVYSLMIIYYFKLTD